jgi:hypothetical protein
MVRGLTKHSAFKVIKKTYSLALIFNAFFTIACATELLAGFYKAAPYWQPFSPYLADGNLIWLMVIAALINIFPSASIGRAIHTGRFLFHHYVYGFAVLVLACIYVVVFTPVSLFNLFLVGTSNVPVNIGRFFVLGGLTLFLDDLPDVNTHIESGLNWLKRQACRGRKIIYGTQIVTGVLSVYLLVAITVWTVENLNNLLFNSFLIGTLLITCITTFAHIKRRDWLKITP